MFPEFPSEFAELTYHAYPARNGVLMSAESPEQNNSRDRQCRRMREEESILLAKLVRGTGIENKLMHDLDDLYVEDLIDGGMKSIKFNIGNNKTRRFGKEIVEATYVDKDGVPVSITINLDQDGNIFELDFWKADNSKLIKYPHPAEVEIIIR